VSVLLEREGYPIKASCGLLDLSHSTYYYPPVQTDETTVEAVIDEIAGQYPTYGTRRVTHQLRRLPYEMQGQSQASTANNGPKRAFETDKTV
jgi:hypothetical protein